MKISLLKHGIGLLNCTQQGLQPCKPTKNNICTIQQNRLQYACINQRTSKISIIFVGIE
jgi:hypothetical protein